MGVDTPHPLYSERLEEWQRCRDACEGEDAIKEGRDKYLPRPSGMEPAEYAAYVKRAMYFEAVPRTVAGFVGAIARKPPKIEIPAKLQPLIFDASSDGLSLSELIKRLTEESILQGRAGILVDFNEKTKLPYLAIYTTENIVNWAEDWLVLKETVYQRDPDDRFTLRPVDQYRELAIVDGVYTVTLWTKNESGSDAGDAFVPRETTQPTRAGKPFDKIPFYWVTPKGKTNAIERPPMLGIVNISISHFRSSADLEHGRHFSGMPTLYIVGISDTEKPIRVGSAAAICIPGPEGKVGYADFNGDGLGSLERGLRDKEAQMSALGAAVLMAAQRKGVEAAETARLRVSGENSLLGGVVDGTEEALNAALRCAAEWVAATGEVKVELNRDFVSSIIEPQLLQGMVAAYQAGAYSLDSFLYAMQRGDLIPPEKDLTEEAKQVAAEHAKRLADKVAIDVATKQNAIASAVE